MTEELNFKAICDLTTNVLNMPKGSLALRSRKRPLQVARSVAAYIGRSEEDIHRKVIGKVLNRDRSLIYHYENRHSFLYRSCSLYRDTFSSVYKAYKDIDNEKEIFINGKLMKEYLLKNNVKESKDSDVILRVKSGEAICDINTCYFKFSSQLENIKFAMEKYYYTIKML
ncbi:MAG: hypothetical protein Tp172MES593141_32 [Prokaryotic dsDNA virus sp.]|nr:MAG: hypothetical protein Tp172MES593141_32 [Prokaryotic dsDNA virus sp.]|tara:strand:- start:371 stop:880 length:510 start_codon:yes stop_codon:yes gene_type:complete